MIIFSLEASHEDMLGERLLSTRAVSKCTFQSYIKYIKKFDNNMKSSERREGAGAGDLKFGWCRVKLSIYTNKSKVRIWL